MMKRALSIILGFVLLTSMGTSNVYAETAKSNVVITLIDQTNPIKKMGGAKFKLEGLSHNCEATLPPNESVEAFPDVPHGNYTLTITMQGYETYKETLLISGPVNLEIKMIPVGNLIPVPSPTPTPTPTPATPTPTSGNYPPRGSTEPKHTSKADVLKSLGLFVGSSSGYSLEEPLLRAQGAVMLVRLLGKDADVKGNNYTHPFTDVPEWANNYVGYLYQNKLTYGVGGDKYGSFLPMTKGQYLAFVCRALGYQDKESGFTLDNVTIFAWLAGIFSNAEYSEYKNKDVFLRDDAVLVSYNALKAKAKTTSGSWRFFVQKLVEAEAINKDAVINAGILPAQCFSPNWVVEITPLSYNNNVGGDWEVYQDVFEVVDYGKIGNAVSSPSSFRFSRGIDKSGMIRGWNLIVKFADGVKQSYDTHTMAFIPNLEDAQYILPYLQEKDTPTPYFEHNISITESSILFGGGGSTRYLVFAERTKNGLKSYVVLKRKYNFSF